MDLCISRRPSALKESALVPIFSIEWKLAPLVSRTRARPTSYAVSTSNAPNRSFHS